MYETRGLLILGAFAMIILANLAASKIVYPASATNEDIGSLKAITQEQALPFIFFPDRSKRLLQCPMGITKAEIIDGRLASGTEFYTMPPEAQIFFCPYSQPSTNTFCLAPTKFEESQVLQCQHTVKPRVYPDNAQKRSPCGQEEVGDWMVMSYNICGAAFPYASIYKARRANPYSFCYHKSSKKVLFVYYLTSMANLLSEKLLVRERKLELDETLDTDMNGFMDQNYHQILEAQAKSYPEYKFQYMLPPDYETLVVYRKAAYHSVNVALQHENLIDFWNEISDHIKTNAMENHHSTRTIMTGTIDIPETELPFMDDENQLHNIWITLVMDRNIKDRYKGLVVLMHNFVTTNEMIENQTADPLNSKQYIDKLCVENLCVDGLQQKFQNVGGQIRCCKVTKTITGLFYIAEKDIQTMDEILEIRDVNYVVE